MRTDEAFRHQCEVRWCVKTFWPDIEAMKAHLDKIKRRRGEPAMQHLRTDVLTEWRHRSAK